MITLKNIKTEYKKLDQSGLPDTLKQSEYDFVIENLDLYNEDGTIKEYIDTFIAKLNEFVEKQGKTETPKVDKPKTGGRKKATEGNEEISEELQYLLDHAVEVKKVTFSTKAFRDLLRNVVTPVGKLTMSKKEINYQLRKFTEGKKRENLFLYLQPTLESPVYIVKDDNDDFVFIKSFISGNRPFIVVVRQGKMVTATLKRKNNIERLLKRGKIDFPDNLSGNSIPIQRSHSQFSLVEIALPFQLTKVTKKTKATKTENQNSDTAKLVETFSEEVRLIRRFNNALGKERQRRSILNIYKDFERRAVERKVKATSPYADVIQEIQKRLKKAIDQMDKSGFTHVTLQPSESSKEFFSKVADISKSTGLRTSATLLKRFVGIEGEIEPDTVKVERILNAVNNAIEKGKICKVDLYWKEINEAKQVMEKYLKGETDKITLSPQALNGLGGIGLGKHDAVTGDNAGNGLYGIVSDFNKALRQYFAGSYPGNTFYLGMPKDILRNLGVENEIILRKDVLNEKVKTHKLTYKDLKNLPILINKPLIVLKYDENHTNRLNVFVSRANKEGLLMCSIDLNPGKRNDIEVNEVKTIHGRRCSQIMSKVKADKLLYNDDVDKIKKLFRDSGVNCLQSEQLFKMLYANLSKGNKKNKKNDKISGITPEKEVYVRYEVDINSALAQPHQQPDTTPAVPFDGVDEPVMPQEQEEKQLTESVNQNSVKSALFSRITDDFSADSTGKIDLPGDLGKFLGYVERYEYSILLRGEKGAGKTRLLYQLMNTFALAGFSVASFSLEIGKGSNIVRDMRNSYIMPTVANNIYIADQTPNGLKDIEDAAKQFDVVCIDSWGKIGKTKPDDFDKLRKKYPKTMFVVIFQSTTNGTARGGSMPEYDAGIVIQVANGGRAYCEKNRYNGEDLTYLVFEQRLEQQPVLQPS